MMMGYWGMGWIGMIVQLLIIVGVIYLLISWFRKDQVTGRIVDNRESSAESILRERYARGEITQEEYEHMRDVLRK